jgi:hypothetical protein
MTMSIRIPFALSLSKGCPSLRIGKAEGQGFDKLSLGGVKGMI